jgi:YidC/Oxa1 family membrane protein insertase
VEQRKGEKMEFLSNIMLDALRFFAYFGGYGWGIVWLTIAVNLALYPLTLSSISSMAAIQRIQPKLQELQKKFKDAPQELQKETMGLYKSEGINPIGGCLPVLLKIPFFLALFWSLQSTAFYEIASNPANQTGFLWINGRGAISQISGKSLAEKMEKGGLIVKAGEKEYVWVSTKKIIAAKDKKDTLKDLISNKNELNVNDIKKVQEGLGKEYSEEEVRGVINAWNRTNDLGKPERVFTPFGPISIMAILIGISTFLMQSTMPAQASSQTQMMTMMMPLLLVFICWNFPAGVQIYWLVSNLMGAAQQAYIMKKPAKKAKKEAK